MKNIREDALKFLSQRGGGICRCLCDSLCFSPEPKEPSFRPKRPQSHRGRAVKKPPYLFFPNSEVHPADSKPVKARNQLTHFPTITYAWRISYPQSAKLEVSGLKQTKKTSTDTLTVDKTALSHFLRIICKDYMLDVG